MPGPGETLDAFAGHWRIFQLRDGHRYSTDDLLAAWFASDSLARADRTPKRALDLGSGIGSVGFFLLWKFASLALTGIEAQAGSLALARRTARYNGVDSRVTLLERDLRETLHERDLREPLADLGTFDLVTGSPPYWDPASGKVSDRPQKGPCRFEYRGGVEHYCARAAETLAPGGLFVLVFDGRQRDRLLGTAAAAGLVATRTRDVISVAGRPPLLVLAAFTTTNGAGIPIGEANEAPLLLREANGDRTPEFRALRQEMGLPPGVR